MFADDVIILSISVVDLQRLIDICIIEFKNIGLDINNNKSCCLRIGTRHCITPVNIIVNNIPLPWKQELRYLGIVINSAKSFKVNSQNCKQKYFRALNGIFGKVGLNTAVAIVTSLVETCCVPILIYACESLLWNESVLRSAEHAYSQAFSKIFNTFDKNIILQCQFYLRMLPIEFKIMSRKINFLKNIATSKNFTLQAVYQGDKELEKICNKLSHNCEHFSTTKKSIWHCFESKLM
jgi:hypothetical protein